MPYEKVGNNEPVCIADEVPFDIPNSWEWVRLGNVLSIFGRIGFRGYTKNDLVPKGKGAITISPSNIKNMTTDFSNNTYVSWEKYKESPEIMISNQDLLLVKTGSSYGKCGIVDSLIEKATINPQLVVLKNILVNRLYLLYALNSSVAKKQYESFVIGTSFPTFSQEKLASLILPIPPYSEQLRIVKKIQILDPFINEYTNTEQRLSRIQLEFPSFLKKSILQEAVQGKLVPQDENDEPASILLERIRTEKQALIKAGKIKKDKNESIIFRRDNSHYEKHGSEEVCIDEELPFEIPDSWVWCRLSNLAYNIFAGGDKPKDFTTNITKENKYPVIANGITNDGILGYTACSTAKANTITVAGRGTIGFSLYRTYEYCPIVRLIVIEQCQDINPQYLQYVIEAFPEKSLGTSIPQLTVPMLKPKLIPVPPLSEQNRIVKQIDKLLSTAKLL